MGAGDLIDDVDPADVVKSQLWSGRDRRHRYGIGLRDVSDVVGSTFHQVHRRASGGSQVAAVCSIERNRPDVPMRRAQR